MGVASRGLGDVYKRQAVACALGYLDFRHDARQWRNGHSNLTSWNEKIMELQALIKTIPTD